MAIASSITSAVLSPMHGVLLVVLDGVADGCSASQDPFQCRLQGILHLLYIAASVLAVVLVVVGVLAYRTYRQNKAAAENESGRNESRG